jgi:hypothetical protein
MDEIELEHSEGKDAKKQTHDFLTNRQLLHSADLADKKTATTVTNHTKNYLL